MTRLSHLTLRNFLIALHRKLGVDIPESDYARLVTLDDLVAYLGAKR